MRYRNAPVFVDAQDRDLQLSDPFRLVLNDRLNGVKFQPCSLFGLQDAQCIPSIEDSMCPPNTSSIALHS